MVVVVVVVVDEVDVVDVSPVNDVVVAPSSGPPQDDNHKPITAHAINRHENFLLI
jgi:hypothetical protein